MNLFVKQLALTLCVSGAVAICHELWTTPEASDVASIADSQRAVAMAFKEVSRVELAEILGP